MTAVLSRLSWVAAAPLLLVAGLASATYAVTICAAEAVMEVGDRSR